VAHQEHDNEHKQDQPKQAAATCENVVSAAVSVAAAEQHENQENDKDSYDHGLLPEKKVRCAISGTFLVATPSRHLFPIHCGGQTCQTKKAGREDTKNGVPPDRLTLQPAPDSWRLLFV